MSKNTLFGNNLYISPMNNTGITPNDTDSSFNKSANIESSFYPMISIE